ncbi:hypothetical protein [Comamonas sp. MYb396]|uniref:hypothetical protein n=1 Tax=Comamonas sp. MYb396 TaxID=2745302 RepID=UPI0030A3B552
MTDKTEAQPEALRVRKYIDRRRASRGLSRDHIHGFDVGDEAEALLLTSDLEAILGRIAFLEAQLSARQAAPVMVVTEAMHEAAVKVLHRANGVEGLPQRMLNAMLSALPHPYGRDAHERSRQ